MNTYIGLDQGSSSTKVILIDETGKLVWKDARPVSTIRLPNNRAEQDPCELLKNIKELLQIALQKAQQLKLSPQAIGLATQRSGVTAWDKSGQALHPLLTWRDRRTTASVDKLKTHFEYITQHTGLPVLPDYSASKIALLQKTFPDDYVGTLDSYLVYNLCDQKEFVTDDTMAARSMLYDLEKGTYSSKLCQIFEVDQRRLARIIGSQSTGLTINGLPLTALLGDGQAALYSYISLENDIILNLGTIAAVSKRTENIVKRSGFISSLFWSSSSNKKYLLEAVTNACGEIITYIAKYLDIKDLETFMSQIELPKSKVKLLAYLPLNGTASPNWQYDLPLVFSDDPKKYSSSEVMLASLLSIGSFIARNIIIFNTEKLTDFSDNGLPATGGLSRSVSLLQYIANVTAISLAVCKETEGSALGVALLAKNQPNQNQQLEIETKIIPQNDWSKQYYQDWLELEEKVLRGDMVGLSLQD